MSRGLLMPAAAPALTTLRCRACKRIIGQISEGPTRLLVLKCKGCKQVQQMRV